MKKDIKYKVMENGCWECISHACDSDGYPVATVDGKQDRIHRHFYRMYKGNIPNGYIIRHTCDNRKCINPNHLILGTHKDNVMDRVQHKRSAIGEKNGRSKLTTEQVKQIILDKTTPKMKLARIFGVDPKVIRDIKQHKTWRWVKI